MKPAKQPTNTKHTPSFSSSLPAWPILTPPYPLLGGEKEALLKVVVRAEKETDKGIRYVREWNWRGDHVEMRFTYTPTGKESQEGAHEMIAQAF